MDLFESDHTQREYDRFLKLSGVESQPPHVNDLGGRDGSKDGFEQPVLWDIANKVVVRSYPGFDGVVFPGAVAISPDDRLVAAAGFKPDP